MEGETLKVEIISGIRELLNSEPATKEGIKTWSESAEKVTLLMQMDHGNLGVPHEFWHYIHDVDIRVKDEEYRRIQVELINGILDHWSNVVTHS